MVEMAADSTTRLRRGDPLAHRGERNKRNVERDAPRKKG